ncbi:MAG TPA: acyl-CoA dehydrogenase family protein [Hyphomicrobiaceae bacterium]|jgi:pimeloyl-CoA dehydrogenase small subunit|nr:acyl-CoA dehydrogenase family protein [Hyphomicrobiaceae bacterium]
MDFDLSDEQRQLRDSVERLLADAYDDLNKRKGYIKEPKGYSPGLWQQYADLGLLAAPFAEEHGGLGQSLTETAIIAEAFGRALAVEPYHATVVLAGGALRHAGNAALLNELVPALAGGQLILALAHQERQARYDLADTATTARADGRGGYTLEGEKVVVLAGDSADKLVVSARVSGARADRVGVGLFLVDAKANGVTRRGYPTQDGMRAADVTLSSVKLGPEAVLAGPERGMEVLERVVDEGIAALSAEAVGAMAGLNELTVEYLKTRKQFGVPIGSFQVLQHRAVDMLTALEQARSMAYYATMMAAEPDAAERRRAVAAAKVQVGRSARFVGESAVQLHGGIGMTMEYKAGHYFKRLSMIDLAFGDADHHLRELARLGGLS